LLIDELIAPVSGAEFLGKKRKDQYKLVDYMCYEASPSADEAKKILETSHMLNVVLELESRTSTRTALDIGCATGRWPTWLALRGYQAHGYDISEIAIDICNKQAEKNKELDMSFTLHDISDGSLINDHFALVTCMMGTFNHVPQSRLSAFLEGITHTLINDGLFAFTSWNVSSPFCDFLQLDSQTAKDTLRRNVVDIVSLKAILQANGLRVIKEIPMCLLPNKCYDVWENSLEDASIQHIDAFLRETLADGRPQMHFIVSEKIENNI
jgi:SAM-dependent methyltransferase